MALIITVSTCGLLQNFSKESNSWDWTLSDYGQPKSGSSNFTPFEESWHVPIWSTLLLKSQKCPPEWRGNQGICLWTLIWAITITSICGVLWGSHGSPERVDMVKWALTVTEMDGCRGGGPCTFPRKKKHLAFVCLVSGKEPWPTWSNHPDPLICELWPCFLSHMPIHLLPLNAMYSLTADTVLYWLSHWEYS